MVKGVLPSYHSALLKKWSLREWTYHSQVNSHWKCMGLAEKVKVHHVFPYPKISKNSHSLLSSLPFTTREIIVKPSTVNPTQYVQFWPIVCNQVWYSLQFWAIWQLSTPECIQLTDKKPTLFASVLQFLSTIFVLKISAMTDSLKDILKRHFTSIRHPDSSIIWKVNDLT